MAPLPAQPAPNDSVNLEKWSGLKNVVDPERFKPEELARAQNIDIDDEGEIHRRRGITLVNPGNWHSIWTTNSGNVLGVQNGILGFVAKDFSFHPFAGLSNVGSNYLSYVQVGTVVYFSSITASGKIDSKVSPPTVQQWGVLGGDKFWYSPVVHPDNTQLIPAITGGIQNVVEYQLASEQPTLPPIGGRLFGSPPLARYLAFWNGRIYMAADNTLWATELYLYDYVDATKTYKIFESPITGLGVVQDGIYVATKSNLWFLSGPTFHELQSVLVSIGGVVPGSVSYAPEHLVSPQTQRGQGDEVSQQNAVLMLQGQSIIVCVKGGTTYDLTHDKFILPSAVKAATIFRQQDGLNQFIAVQDSGGDPVNNARFGDRVSAQLIRNGVIVND